MSNNNTFLSRIKNNSIKINNNKIKTMMIIKFIRLHRIKVKKHFVALKILSNFIIMKNRCNAN